ncbi:MAG: carbamoyltransferase HypF [Burkholderiales bacterium]|nr:carbamoyltransferase HypF [Burkholderiales bacterium]
MSIAPVPSSSVVARHAIRVRGAVQGVGFRPFVWRLAQELSLSGWVRNDSSGVAIEVQGHSDVLDRFVARLARDAPPLARIDAIERRELGTALRRDFDILPSSAGRASTRIAADTAVCADCLTELFDPRDRRYRYAFINCTNCGPRYTISQALPYDRANTSMAPFALCRPCRSEYGDPDSRRLHAQPNACPDCGPTLTLVDADGMQVHEGDVVAAALARLYRGEIVALKGLGGFHLACDARNAAAVARLRARKGREEKPFAVMIAGAASLGQLAEIGDGEHGLLDARERPIVLLRKKAGCDALLAGVAPGIAWLGAMLPYTPLQYLLFHQAAGCPEGCAWLDRVQSLVLVMTSANPGGEPLLAANAEALERLAGIADAFVLHDRDIVVRCDDSVVFAGVGAPAFVRRARGYTPAPIRLARTGPSVLALGGHLKSTICITRGDEAFVSQHLGDLDNVQSCKALDEAVIHLLRTLEIEPELVAHDLHPDYYSSRYAADFAARRALPAVAVQHHHAHIAAVAAEHGLRTPVLGLALDGVGLGADGGIWGGELLHVEAGMAQRLGHLRELRLPGGDRAAREPWRMAASVLFELGRAGEIERRYASRGGAILAQMLARAVNSAPTSSAGRWFDAAAGLLGVSEVCSYEGQAAMLLEGLAEAHGPAAPLPGGYRIEADGTLDLLPLLAHLAGQKDQACGAAVFHATFAAALADWVGEASARSGVRNVALGGGCFVNRILAMSLRRHLQAAGLAVFEARLVPPNDGGLALGQAAVAMAAAAD